MKRIGQLSGRMLAVMLAGALTLGSISVSVPGAETAGDAAAAADTSQSVEEEASEQEAGSSYEAEPDPDDEDSSAVEEAAEEGAAEDTVDDAVTSFTVILDANGGYFENEWDDVLGKYLEKTEVLNKVLPAGEIVKAVPVKEQGDTASFLGWSLARDGELLTQGEYAPTENCVLFAVWSDENEFNEEEEEAEAESDEIPEEPVDSTMEGPVEEETGNDEASAPDGEENEKDQNDGAAKSDDSESSTPTEKQPDELAEDKDKNTAPTAYPRENVSEEANTAAVKSYDVNSKIKATLKDGVLTVSGSGAIPDYNSDSAPKWLNEMSQIKKVVIGSGITRVGNWAFIDADQLQTVSLGSVKSIGEAAFCRSGLRSVTIPNTVTSLGEFAFDGCPDLTSVVIGNGVKVIPYECFYECSALASVSFGSGVQSIDNLAFAYCALETLTLPANIKELGVGVFGECRNLKKVTTKGLIYIPYQAFFNDSALTSISLNEGITHIYGLAFYGCSSLSAVTIPASVREIVDGAFPANTVITNKNKDLEKIGTNGYRVDESLYISGTQDYSRAYAVLDLVNQKRKAAGLGSLKMDESLLQTAMLRAAETVVYFSHTRPDGSDCFSANDKMFGENIAMGSRTAKEVMDQWMGSAGHKANILSEDFTTIGVGCFEYNGVYYWVQCFGIYDISSSAAKPSNKKVTAQIYLPENQIDEGSSQTKLTFRILHDGNEGSVRAAVGKTHQLSLYYNGVTFVSSKVYWKSSNTKVATVDANGKLKITGLGTCKITASSKTLNRASITVSGVLPKPGNCRFSKWNNAKYDSCQIAWNKVSGADGYQSLLCWTDGSHATTKNLSSNVLSQNCSVAVNHVSQFKVRAFVNTASGRIYSPWSNVEYITPSPATLKYKKAGTSSKPKADISWNIIYGCNGYNVFLTTNPNGTWYWNQSTSTQAAATSATITSYRGSKLKKGTKYYVRIVTRRKRNGVFCTVPLPANNTYVGSFVVK